jgi:hypothetical protein
MTWKDKLINITFEITTGDGKVFKPLWKDAQKNLNFNTEGFDFIGQEGTFVERKKKSGDQIPLLFYFQGNDCIEQADLFELSARDSRVWTLKHPFLGTLKVQPLSLRFDYTQYNSVKITGTVWQTISRKYPQNVVDAKAEVQNLKSDIDILVAGLFTDSIIPIIPENIQPSLNGAISTESNYEVLIDSDSAAAALKNIARQATGAAQDLLSDATNYINQATALINFPFTLVGNIRSKVGSMVNALNSLVGIFLNADPKNKEIYEFQASLIVSELSRNVVTDDYNNINDVLRTIDDFDSAYNSFIANLDSAGYVGNPDLAIATDLIVNTAISNLFDIAFNAKQEMRIVLDSDSNIIVLANKYYRKGGVSLDDAVAELIANNNISLDEHIQVKKGREIIYFV